MKKISAQSGSPRCRFGEAGVISPVLIVVGVVIVIIIVISIASGAFKFSGSISKNNNQPAPEKSSVVKDEPAAPKNKTYTNTSTGISLEYPEDWMVKENPGEGVLVAFGSPKESSDDKFTDNVNLTVTDISSKPNLTLAQLADIWLKQTESAPLFKMLSRDSVTVGGEPAEKIVFSSSNKGMDIKGSVSITMKNNKAYVITYSAQAGSYDKFAGIASAIASSLKIN